MFRLAIFRIWRWSEALVATSLVWVPSLVLLIGVGTYLWQAFAFLTAPGLPIRLDYVGSNGTYTLTADSYAVFLPERRARVQNAQLAGPTGAKIASVSLLDAWLDGPATVVHAREGEIEVVRNADGTFALASALPKQEEGAEPTPIEFQFERIRWRYSDRSEPNAPMLAGIVPRGHVLALGDRVVITGQVSLGGNPAIDTNLDIEPAGNLYLSAKLPPGEYAPILAHLPAWMSPEQVAEIRQLRATSVRIGGRIAVAMSSDAIEFGGEGTLAATGVSHSDILRNAALSGKWRLTTTGLAGEVTSREPSRRASFDGYLDWSKALRLAGRASASASGARDLWAPLAKLVPKELRLNQPKFNGVVHWSGDAYSVNGNVRSSQLAYSGEQVSDLVGRVAADNRGAVISVQRARYQGVSVQGGFAMSSNAGRISGGMASRERVAIGPFARRAGLEGLSGTAQVRMVLSGTTRRPVVAMDAIGNAKFRPDGEPVRDLGQFQARATLADSRVTVQRFLLAGESGTASAVGSVNLASKKLDLSLIAGGVPLAQLSTDLSGFALARGKITGRFDDPRFLGVGQAFGVEIQDQIFPEITTTLDIDKRRLLASDWKASRGTSTAEGSLALTWKNQSLDGAFRADQLQVSELFDVTAFDAALTVSEGTIGGTVKNPSVNALVVANAIALQRADIKSAQAKVALQNKWVTVSNGFLEFESGGGTFAGNYHLDTKAGGFSSVLDKATLDIQALTGGDLPASGVFSGSAQATIRDGAVEDGNIQLAANDVEIADEKIGSGTVDAAVRAGRWTGRAQLGSQNRFLVAEGLSYDQKTKDLSGSIDLLNVPLEDWLGSRAISSLAKWSPDTRQLARKFQGEVTAHVELGGNADNISVNLPTLAINNFKIGTQDAGTLEAAGSLADGALDIQSLKWAAGDASLQVKGKRDREGNLSGEAQLSRFNLSFLNAWDPSLPSIAAVASGVFEFAGSMDDPRLRGSANAQLVSVDPNAQSASLSLDEIFLDKRVLTANGIFGAEAFSGDVDAKVPLSAFRGNDPTAEPLKATFTLHERKVKDLDAFLPTLDKTRSSGTVSGFVQVFGTIVDLDVSGNLDLKNATVAMENVETTLAVPSLTARYERDRIRLSGRATGSAGGTVDLDMIATLPNILSSETNLGSILNDANLDRFALNIDDLVIKENQKDRDKKLTVRIAPSQIRGSGKLGAPVLNGSIHVADLDAAIPEASTTVLTPTYPVNPLFQSITVQLDNPARIRTTTTNLLIDGGGQIDGTLESPKATALLRLVEGIFQLPNARVALEEGGTLKFRYDASQGTQNSARLDLDLEGRTAITAQRFAEVVERYDITLRITGNLLENGGLRLDASSDPPDLSSSEILAALGQRDLIEQLARGGRGQNGLTQAALSLALPGLTGGLTRGVATAFKLDYLSVEYNAFEKATISAAKTLGKGLTLTLRRQLQEQPGRKTRYEVKLTYRLPTRNQLLSRIRIGVGFDQDRPYKLTLEYFKRF